MNIPRVSKILLHMMNVNAELETIFRAGLERVDPYEMIRERMMIENNQLKVEVKINPLSLDLTSVRNIVVLGTGKASARMAQAVEEILGERLSGGIISTKYGHGEALKKVRIIEAGHPVPDENSLRAGREIVQIGRSFDEHTLVITLLSGGGSALLEALPTFKIEGREVQITLADLRQTTEALLACGATINEINCIRKHISTLKGGQYLGAIQPARSVALILSDVVGDRLDAIASGLTSADPTTFSEALEIIERYGITSRMPETVLQYIQLGNDGRVKETPKPGDSIFSSTHNLLIGTNLTALEAAADQARALGYQPVILTSQLVGEAREAGKFLLAVAKDIRKQNLLSPRPACVIAGGETTVTLQGSGKGGRNQEMALACLYEMEKDPEGCGGIYFLAASTDGSDGPTDAAGAFASAEYLEKARAIQLSPGEYLHNNDSYHFFEKIAGLLKTGPTRTNVCDIQMMIIR
jgi:glycerate 2-kinase